MVAEAVLAPDHSSASEGNGLAAALADAVVLVAAAVPVWRGSAHSIAREVSEAGL